LASRQVAEYAREEKSVCKCSERHGLLASRLPRGFLLSKFASRAREGAPLQARLLRIGCKAVDLKVLGAHVVEPRWPSYVALE
jgi:hypothetical protein